MDSEHTARGTEHLQRAAQELIAAARSFLDAAEEMIDDSEFVQDAAQALRTVVADVGNLGREHRTPEPGASRPSGGTGAPDVDLSGGVDAADLALLLGSWGPCPPQAGCAADFNEDDLVDAADLALLLGSWGACLP